MSLALYSLHDFQSLKDMDPLGEEVKDVQWPETITLAEDNRSGRLERRSRGYPRRKNPLQGCRLRVVKGKWREHR